MDRGRQIDNIQNSNAVYIDRFGKSGKTSTKIINPPGGKDNFSLGWEEPQKNKSNIQSQNYPMNKPKIERKKETEPRKIHLNIILRLTRFNKIIIRINHILLYE